jgi:hypothetical protein
VVKPFRLGFEPLTNAEYVELLNIGNLSDPDKEALRKCARAYELPLALSESENAQRAIFRGLFDSARMLSAKQLVPLTSDEQAAPWICTNREPLHRQLSKSDADPSRPLRCDAKGRAWLAIGRGADYELAAHWNMLAAQAGWDVRLQISGPVLPPAPPQPGDEGLDAFRTKWREINEAERHDIAARLRERLVYWPGPCGGAWARLGRPYKPSPKPCHGFCFIEHRPGAAIEAAGQLKRGAWLSDVFAALWLIGEGDPVHPGMFDAQAGRHWDERLRHRVVGKRLGDPADLACSEAERRRKQTRDWIEGIAAVWNTALERQGTEGVIPTIWPLRWTESGPIPTSKPQEADKSEIVTDPETGKQVALFAIDNSRGALTPFPIQWRVGIGPNTWSVDRSDLEERKAALSSAARSIEATPLETHYLQKRKLLPTPRSQQILRRTGTLYRDTWNDFQLDTRTQPVYRDEVGIVEVEEDEIDA